MELFQQFKKYPNLRVFLSAKSDGSMRFLTPADPENRKTFLLKNGVPIASVVTAGLVHGKNIVRVSAKNAGTLIEGCDGLVTNEKNVFLAITVADCLPFYFYDARKQVIGLVHAGWPGLKQGILSVMIEKLQQEFGVQPEGVLVGIGPSIGVCHFEVQEDVLVQFEKYHEIALRSENGKTFLNLKSIAKQQLIDSGVSPDNIEASDECTACLPEKYFSYRRDKPERVHPMLAVIGMRPDSD